MSYCQGKKDDEIFVGNTRLDKGIPDYLSCLKTVRLGDQALDIYGRELDPSYMLPVFIGRSESDKYEQIMAHQTALIRRSK
jgi:hypothetical protein